MAELEKLGQKYRIALRIARDERWERLKCGHKGTYADDCIVDRIMRHKIYIVATNDRDLKRRIRKVPGVPIMSVARGKYVIERLPGELTSIRCRLLPLHAFAQIACQKRPTRSRSESC